MREIRISDSTMKRSANLKTLTLSFKEKLETVKQLDRLGISIIEIEGIVQPKPDSLRIKSIASQVKNGTLAVPVQMDRENIDLVWAALAEAKSPRLQVEAAVSPARMEYVYKKKAPAMIADVAETIGLCAKLTKDVEFIADDATRANGDYLREIVAKAIEAGATTVTICDNAGTMLPEEFARFLTSLVEDVPQMEKVNLGISCSNDLFMADACSIAGIMAGANEVKATTYPMDIASLDNLAKILGSKSESIQATCPVRVTEINRAVNRIARILVKDGESTSLFSGIGKTHDEGMVLTAHDDINAVMQCVEQLGYTLSDEDAAAVYESFQDIAAKKEAVGSLELEAIVASSALQVPATYTVDRYVINSGNTIKSTATVRMKKGGEFIESVSLGDGPIDAAFHAIENIVGESFELDDFQIKAVTEGQEAMGEAIVKLAHDGKLYSGRGISTDIVGSSIRAYVSALNKIVYEG